MRRPPPCVLHVARTHWLVGAIILASVGAMHVMTRRLPAIEFGPRTYAITLGLGVLYLLAGTLVWLGAPLGRVISRICSLLYLARPGFGLGLWEAMNLPEFAAHFQRKPRAGHGRTEDAEHE